MKFYLKIQAHNQLNSDTLKHFLTEKMEASEFSKEKLSELLSKKFREIYEVQEFKISDSSLNSDSVDYDYKVVCSDGSIILGVANVSVDSGVDEIAKAITSLQIKQMAEDLNDHINNFFVDYFNDNSIPDLDETNEIVSKVKKELVKSWKISTASKPFAKANDNVKWHNINGTLYYGTEEQVDIAVDSDTVEIPFISDDGNGYAPGSSYPSHKLADFNDELEEMREEYNGLSDDEIRLELMKLLLEEEYDPSAYDDYEDCEEDYDDEDEAESSTKASKNKSYHDELYDMLTDGWNEEKVDTIKEKLLSLNPNNKKFQKDLEKYIEKMGDLSNSIYDVFVLESNDKSSQADKLQEKNDKKLEELESFYKEKIKPFAGKYIATSEISNGFQFNAEVADNEDEDEDYDYEIDAEELVKEEINKACKKLKISTKDKYKISYEMVQYRGYEDMNHIYEFFISYPEEKIFEGLKKEMLSHSTAARTYTIEQQELFNKVSNTFNRLRMSGQGDTNEVVNFKNGQLKMMKKNGKVMLEYKQIMESFENLSSLQKFLEENLDYYIFKINKGYSEASTYDSFMSEYQYEVNSLLKKLHSVKEDDVTDEQWSRIENSLKNFDKNVQETIQYWMGNKHIEAREVAQFAIENQDRYGTETSQVVYALEKFIDCLDIEDDTTEASTSVKTSVKNIEVFFELDIDKEYAKVMADEIAFSVSKAYEKAELPKPKMVTIAVKNGDVKGQEPAEKDIQRIKDLETKAKGDEAKMLKLAQNMANTLGVSPDSVDKAIRRAKACEIVYPGPLGKKLAKIFMDTAVNQKSVAGALDEEIKGKLIKSVNALVDLKHLLESKKNPLYKEVEKARECLYPLDEKYKLGLSTSNSVEEVNASIKADHNLVSVKGPNGQMGVVRISKDKWVSRGKEYTLEEILEKIIVKTGYFDEVAVKESLLKAVFSAEANASLKIKDFPKSGDIIWFVGNEYKVVSYKDGKVMLSLHREHNKNTFSNPLELPTDSNQWFNVIDGWQNNWGTRPSIKTNTEANASKNLETEFNTWTDLVKYMNANNLELADYKTHNMIYTAIWKENGVAVADESISKETLEKIKKDKELQSLVKELIKTEKERDKVRPAIDKLYNKILEKYEFFEDRSGQKITDHTDLYKSDQTIKPIKEYYEECNKEARKLYPNTKEGYCPALVIENQVMSIENQIIEKLEDYYPFLKKGFLDSKTRKQLLSLHKSLFSHASASNNYSEFINYFRMFYDPKNKDVLHPEMIGPGWTDKDIIECIEKRGKDFEGDTFDREAIRDMLIEKFGEGKTIASNKRLKKDDPEAIKIMKKYGFSRENDSYFFTKNNQKNKIKNHINFDYVGLTPNQFEESMDAHMINMEIEFPNLFKAESATHSTMYKGHKIEIVFVSPLSNQDGHKYACLIDGKETGTDNDKRVLLADAKDFIDGMKAESATHNEGYGFYGVLRSEFGRKESDELFKYAENIIAKELKVSTKIVGALLDFKIGRWFGEEVVLSGKSVSETKKKMKEVLETKYYKEFKKTYKEQEEEISDYLTSID